MNMRRAKKPRYTKGLENIPGAEDTWGAAEGSRRTSLDLPIALWQRVKLQAIREGMGFKSLTMRALEQYLAKPKKGAAHG